MSPNDTFGRILLGLTFADSSAVMPSFSFPFDIVVEVVLSPFASAEIEEVECVFDLVLVAARILCSRDDLKRLNVLSWMSGLTGGSEILGGVGWSDLRLFLPLHHGQLTLSEDQRDRSTGTQKRHDAGRV